MPEGPECRIIADKLHEQFAGSTLIRIISFSSRIDGGDVNLVVTQIYAVGKTIVIASSTTKGIIMHLALTGFETGGESRAVLIFDNNGVQTLLPFYDPINLATIRIVDRIGDALSKLGPDILHIEEWGDVWQQLLKLNKSRKMLCNALLEQSIIAGIGNYLRADIMWHSRIAPQRICNTLTSTELHTLFTSMCMVCQRALYYVRKSATYKGGEKMLIYGKSKSPTGGKVVRMKMGSRTIHWVPSEQE